MKGKTPSGLTKFTVVSIAVIYSCLSIGILQTMHHCMGRIAGVSYFSVDEKKCLCYQVSGKEMDCCHDEHALIQLDDDHQLASVKALSAPLFLVITQALPVFSINSTFSKEHGRLITDSSPPPREGLYKLHCSFVYYGDEEIG